MTVTRARSYTPTATYYLHGSATYILFYTIYAIVYVQNDLHCTYFPLFYPNPKLHTKRHSTLDAVEKKICMLFNELNVCTVSTISFQEFAHLFLFLFCKAVFKTFYPTPKVAMSLYPLLQSTVSSS